MKRLPTKIPLLLAGIFFILPGCTRYVCWLTDVFNQGRKQPTYICEAQRYLRSVRIYDQLNTLGSFDAIWLHPQVRQAYLDAYDSTHCLSSEQFAMMGRQEEREDHDFIMFYLLAATSDGELLNDPLTEWSIQVWLDGACFAPVEIKTVTLPPEYRRFFGPWFTNFKKQYLIKFNALDDRGRELGFGANKVQLVVSRLGKVGILTWCLDAAGNVLNDQSFNKNVLAYDLDTNF
jgi:hypothetical protein